MCYAKTVTSNKKINVIYFVVWANKLWIVSSKGRIQRNNDAVFKELINQDNVWFLMLLCYSFIKIIRVNLHAA